MEKRKNNIFYNIIKNETSLTEVFCNLMQYKNFRDLFLNIVNEKNKLLNLKEFKKSSINYNNFSTEVSFKKNDKKLGRGDLILKDNDDNEYIFELKIEKYTTLTLHQPEDYLEYLDNDNSKLFFIIPKRYMHINDIYNRWYAKTSYSKKNIKQHIIFWEDILKEINENELNKLNSFINEFCNILDYRWFFYPEIKFSNYEIDILFQEQKNKKEELLMLKDTNVPKVINKLFKIVEEVDNKLETMKDNAKTDEYYGYILKNKYLTNKNIEVWFGVDFEIWERHNYPLTVQVYSEDKKEMENIKKLNFSTPFKYEDGEETTFIGLEKNVFESEVNIVETFEDLIHKLIERLNQT